MWEACLFFKFFAIHLKLIIPVLVVLAIFLLRSQDADVPGPSEFFLRMRAHPKEPGSEPGDNAQHGPCQGQGQDQAESE